MMKIAIVGPCAGGKTTLAKKLCEIGYNARDVAQEHSDVPTMWRETDRPDAVIYLDVSLPVIRQRLRVDWDQNYFDRLVSRLADAREHAHFVLDTNDLSQVQVVEQVLKFLQGLHSA